MIKNIVRYELKELLNNGIFVKNDDPEKVLAYLKNRFDLTKVQCVVVMPIIVKYLRKGSDDDIQKVLTKRKKTYRKVEKRIARRMTNED